jgi:DNA polymerase-3 subunit gamma/tau
MSYLVLARKYRPRSFEELVGQEHVVQALVNALKSQRLHHAYLFTGTRGVGKTTVSRILAKSLNCTGPDGSGGITATPCGVCDACREIDAGRFVDYVELDAASNRGVEEISQLLDQAVYKPVVGRFKVYMIDEVHMLSNHAFNAMLKTLEEPPEYLKFVLATTDPQKVPPTVLSRCLQFNLRPMAPDTMQGHLAHVLSAEGIESEPGALRLLARAAQGSMRDALSLTDQAIAYGAGRLDEPALRRMLGAVDRGHAVRIVEALAAADGAALVGTIDELRALGLSANGLLEEFAALLQQMAVVQAVPQAADETDPDTPALLRLAGMLAADETQLYYSIALRGREELALAPDEYSGVVMVLLRMLAFRPAGVGEQPASRRSEPATVASGARATTVASPAASDTVQRSVASPAASAAVEPVVAAPNLTAQTSVCADRWAEVVSKLIDQGAIGALVRELAMQAQCLAIEPGGVNGSEVWRLRVERDTLRAPAQRDKLQAALAALLDRPIQLELEAGVATDSPGLREAALRAQRQAQAERIIENDPFVQSIKQQFKSARIVPGSVKPMEQRS